MNFLGYLVCSGVAFAFASGCRDYTCADTATCPLDPADGGAAASAGDGDASAEVSSEAETTDVSESSSTATSTSTEPSSSETSDSLGAITSSETASGVETSSSASPSTTEGVESSTDLESTTDLEGTRDGDTAVAASSEPEETSTDSSSEGSEGPTVKQVVVGFSHRCALSSDGRVRCWGIGAGGRLGYGNTNNVGDDEALAAAGDVNVGGTVVSLAAGSSHTCALLDTGSVRCWGSGGGGKLGYGNTNNIGDDEAPAVAGDVNVGGTVVSLTAGDSHTCALLDTGRLRCWGYGFFGQLGYGNRNNVGDDEAPAVAGDVNVGGTVVKVSAGGSHTCALLNTGSVRCWGLASSGQLGYGNTNTVGDDEAPSIAGDVNVGGTVVDVSAKGNRTCALLDTGRVCCWGEMPGNERDGNPNNIGDDEEPAIAGDLDVGETVVSVSTGSHHTCALLETGRVRCWDLGSNPADMGDVDIGF